MKQGGKKKQKNSRILKKVAWSHFFQYQDRTKWEDHTQVSLYTRSQFSPRIFLISCSLYPRFIRPKVILG